MNYELSVIKLLLNHDKWLQYKDKIVAKKLPKKLYPVFLVLESWHKDNESSLSVSDFANLLLAQQHKDPDFYNDVLSSLEKIDASVESSEALLKGLIKKQVLNDIALAAYELSEGRGDEQQLKSLYDSLNVVETQQQSDFEFVTDDLEQLLDDTYRTPGLRWRLNTLNKMFGSLRPGDFGFIFARPETGKTTFLASETTFMAGQLAENAGPVIWFNNEEANNKVRIRCFQAALGATLSQINSNAPAARKAFIKATKGKHMLLNNPGSIGKGLIERVVAQYKPSLVIYDQIDKIEGFSNDREDLRLGSIYQWARDLGKKQSFATIAVCQADGSGEGQKWLTMANVANAKTAKQQEADWILGIGKTHDVGFEALRYLHASKNKLSGDEDTDPALRHGKLEVLIKPELARYEDLK